MSEVEQLSQNQVVVRWQAPCRQTAVGSMDNNYHLSFLMKPDLLCGCLAACHPELGCTVNVLPRDVYAPFLIGRLRASEKTLLRTTPHT